MNQKSLNPAINEKEAATFIGVAVQTLRNWRHQRRGPTYHKVGSRVVYLTKDLKSYIEKRRIDPEKRRCNQMER